MCFHKSNITLRGTNALVERLSVRYGFVYASYLIKFTIPNRCFRGIAV